MPKLYRAVPLDVLYAPHLDDQMIRAGSDLDAADQAKKSFGPDMPFVLWEGERRVLSFTPIAHLLRTRTQTRMAGV